MSGVQAQATPMLAAPAVTLGILAGGRGWRLGGVDKAWLLRDGVPQVQRWRTRFANAACAVLVSANRDPARLREAGFEVVADAVADAGPVAGLEALAQACRTPWLLTLPVDLCEADAGVLHALAGARARDGAYAVDIDGPQPLVALWRTAALHDAARAALDAGQRSARGLQDRLDMAAVRFDGIRFGNLNTPEDLAAAGAVPPTP